MKTVFIRVIEAEVEHKATSLRAAVHSDIPNASSRFDVEPSLFVNIETSPFAYWISDGLLRLFQAPNRLRGFAETRCGMSTLDDFRFVRLQTERDATRGHKWVPYVKGNTYQPYFDSLETCVNWGKNGDELKVFVEQKVGSASRKIQAEGFYFHPGISWVRRTHRLCVRVLPKGCIFTGGAQAAFDPSFSRTATLRLLGLLSSSIFDALTKVSVGRTGDAVQFESGMLDRVPMPESDDLGSDLEPLAPLARQAWALQRSVDTRTETSHAFVLPALLQVDGPALSDRANDWVSRVSAVGVALTDVRAQIDDCCFALYGIDGAARDRIEQGFTDHPDHTESPEGDDGDNNEVDIEPMAASLLSWSLGVAFGRFDIRLATGDRALPSEPDPFDPLPACSPGMLTGSDSLPLTSAPADYPLAFPEDGILVDDPGHPENLLGRVRAVFEVVFGDDASERLLEAEGHIGRRTEDLRGWFAHRFFALHIKRYSKSRRKAPIYWQLGTPSGSYSVWLYAHRFNPDTLFHVHNEFVVHKLSHEEEELARLVRDAGPEPSRGQRDEIDAKETFVGELRAFKAEVARVAPLWRPDLDDGVLINSAPLWRLVAHERSWQTQCKKTWDELVAGKYDWAHLAMHLWPERVVPKCQEDRSLAIAHGLEDALWYEDDQGSWEPRAVNDVDVRALIEARSSTAVKAAVADLLSARPPAGSKQSRGRSRRSGSARASSTRTRKSRTSPAVDESLVSKVHQAIAAVASGASKNDVLDAADISPAEWTAAIKVLLDRGHVAKTGRARGTRYHDARKRTGGNGQ